MAIHQYSTMDALMLGRYQKAVSVKDALKSGNLGVGTFEGMYGEALIIDGKCYNGVPGGKVVEAKPEDSLAFCTVGEFSMAGTLFQVNDVKSLQELKIDADEVRKAETGSDNYPCLCRIDGKFTSVRVRACEKQEEPYKPLGEVSKSQVESEIGNIEGTLIGIWFPEWCNRFNLAGWHFHFISKDRQTFGGHCLECSLSSGLIGTKKELSVQIEMPDDESFAGLNLNQDLSEVKDRVENSSQN